MKKISVKASGEYDILIGSGLLEKSGSLIKELAPVCRVAVITDDIVDELYSDTVENSFEEAGLPFIKYVFPHGETSKSMENYAGILEFLAENQFTRGDIIVALGGGVVGDISGFCAATYLRGIRFVQVPTTFLAAVDSSVGGKTAINLQAGKNLAGAFLQPSLVICDTDTFSTLPDMVFADGTAEAVKYGMIFDEELFEKMSGNFREDIEEIVAKCVEIKAKVVEKDEFDKGERQLLNFGHTVGHSIEKCSNFEISHGAAVSMGMVIISKSAEKDGFAQNGTTGRLTEALEKGGLPVNCPFSAKELAAVSMNDKKRNGDEITFVMPKKAGECVLVKTPVSKIEEVIGKGL